MIIVNIDGPNGVGKTTVTEHVLQYFNYVEQIKTGFVHFHRRGLPIGDLIQKVLNGEIKMDPASLQMLYSADRLDFSNQQIEKYRKDGVKILLVDRYITSGIVHGMSDGVDPIQLKNFDRYTKSPNINIILTAPLDVLVKRLKTQKLNEGETSDIYEAKDKLDKICMGYNKLHKYVPYVKYVDASRSKDKVVYEVIDIINTVREDDFQTCSLD